MSVDTMLPKPRSKWTKLANDRKVLVSINVCTTDDGLVIEVRESAICEDRIRDAIGLAVKDTCDRLKVGE